MRQMDSTAAASVRSTAGPPRCVTMELGGDSSNSITYKKTPQKTAADGGCFSSWLVLEEKSNDSKELSKDGKHNF